MFRPSCRSSAVLLLVLILCASRPPRAGGRCSSSTRTDTKSRGAHVLPALRRLRGGMEEVLGGWAPDDSEEDALVQRMWDKRDPQADEADQQDLKERLANLTAYGVELGILQDGPPKDEWEPQNSEEEATMRHGKSPTARRKRGVLQAL